jgi:ATP-dependent DNA helicase RecG
MMPAAYDKLDKILRLEQKQGYRNRAVIGGLENLSVIWQEEAQSEAQDENQVDQVNQIADLLKAYADADGQQREQTVADILSLLGNKAPADPVRRQPPLRKPGSQATETASMPAPAPELPQPATATPPPEHPEAVTTAPPREHPASGLRAPVTSLPGISSAYAARLGRLGIDTVGDLLHHVPHRYDDYRSLKPINQLEYGDETTVIGTIWETTTRKTRGGTTIVSSIIADASGTIEAVWFNQPYLVRQLRGGRQIVLSGKVDEYLGRLILQSPVWEPLEKEQIHTGRLVPIYPLTGGVTARWMRRLMKRVVDHWAPRLADHLPEGIRERAGLMALPDAIRQIHFPDSQQTAETARNRLSFDEFLFIQLGMLHQRQKWQNQTGIPIPRNQGLLDTFLGSLPYELTNAQQRGIDQILEDMARPQPMGRLLQGDVGSGKTVVATAAMLMAAAVGKQSALMAPTEILAEQHYKTISELLADAGDWGLERPVSVVLLTGSLRRVARGKVYAALASGQADIVVGTQALIQKHVTFKDLGLVIVDEEQRFGVAHKERLKQLRRLVDVLTLTATPIPRTLYMSLMGARDLSVINTPPRDRRPIKTEFMEFNEEAITEAILRELDRGGQVYFVHNRVQSIQAMAGLVSRVVPQARIGVAHGQMPERVLEGTMMRFLRRDYDVLVSTTII